MFLIALILFGIAICNAEECSAVLNEINSGSPAVFTNQDFIELKMFCDGVPKSKSLQGYKLIGISTGNQNSDKMTIELVVNLWNSKSNNNGFLTIGTKKVKNSEIDTESQYMNYRNKFSGDTNVIQSFLNAGQKNLHAIALIYKKSYSFPELVINKKKPYLIINDKIKELIRNNIVDLIVYGRKAPYDNCVLFSNLCSDYAKKDYVLREFDNNKDNIDRTLNRCSLDTSAFTPEKFKLGTPTPGEENDCTGIHFSLENISNLSDPLNEKTFDEDNIERNELSHEQVDSAQCSSVLDASAYENLNETLINSQIALQTEEAHSSSCSVLNLDPDLGNICDEIDRNTRRKRRLSETDNYTDENEWDTTIYFE